MQAHQVFDVSIPSLQSPGCHGNTLGGSGSRVTVVGEEQSEKKKREGGGQLAWASFVSSGSLWPSLLIKSALTKGILLTPRQKAGQFTQITGGKNQSTIYHAVASLRTAALECGQNTWVKDVRFM